MTPTLALIYMKGCGACEAAMPEFKKLAASLPSNWRIGLLDIDRPGLNLDFPVRGTPTLYFAYNGKRFATDPPTLNRNFTAHSMRQWIDAAIAKSRG